MCRCLFLNAELFAMDGQMECFFGLYDLGEVI